MATCIVCAKENPAYRCPSCMERYCSVSCSKEHKITCSPPEKAPESVTKAETTKSDSEQPEEQLIYDKIANDPEIKNLLRSTALQEHLQLVASILQNPEVSGEPSKEGRRAVALKKLRRLRKGGSEENEAVEEFASLSCQLLKGTSSD